MKQEKYSFRKYGKYLVSCIIALNFLGACSSQSVEHSKDFNKASEVVSQQDKRQKDNDSSEKNNSKIKETKGLIVSQKPITEMVNKGFDGETHQNQLEVSDMPLQTVGFSYLGLVTKSDVYGNIIEEDNLMARPTSFIVKSQDDIISNGQQDDGVILDKVLSVVTDKGNVMFEDDKKIDKDHLNLPNDKELVSDVSESKEADKERPTLPNDKESPELVDKPTVTDNPSVDTDKGNVVLEDNKEIDKATPTLPDDKELSESVDKPTVTDNPSVDTDKGNVVLEDNKEIDKATPTLPDDKELPELVDKPTVKVNPVDRLHVLKRNESSDFMLLQSNGLFGFVDVGTYRFEEDKGYVYRYLDGLGVKNLDFLFITHFDIDHFNYIYKGDLLSRYNVNRVIFKPMVERADNEYKNKNAKDSYKQYLEVVDKLESLSIPYGFEKHFALGDFKLTTYNEEDNTPEELPASTNFESLGLLVEKDGYRTFLAGDIEQADEPKLAEQLGDVDVLKLGHHGFSTSTTKVFTDGLSPEVGIITHNNKTRQSALYNQAPDMSQYYAGDGTVVVDYTDTSDGITIYQEDSNVGTTVVHTETDTVKYSATDSQKEEAHYEHSVVLADGLSEVVIEEE